MSKFNGELCQNCGELFQCELSAGADTCWCLTLPFRLPLPSENAKCYCPKCLKALWTQYQLS